MNEPSSRPPLSAREKVALAIAAAGILVLSVFVAVYMMSHKPRAERRKPGPTVPVVTVQELSLSDYLVVIPAMGNEVPSKEVELKTQVGGKVIWSHPEFVEGGIKGTISY